MILLGESALWSYNGGMLSTQDINTALTLHEAIEREQARRERGPWVPAHNGTEVPCKVGCYRYLYMYQASTRTHAYLCLDTDMFLDDAEADRIFGH
jgi:hypothetical protein